MPDQHVVSCNKPLHLGREVCEAAFVRPPARICENSHTHKLSLSTPAASPNTSHACICGGFFERHSLKCPRSDSRSSALLSHPASAGIPTLRSSQWMLPPQHDPALVILLLFHPFHRSHVQYSLSGGASGMPLPPAPARVNRPVETNCSYAAFSASVYSRSGSVSL